MRLRMMAGLGAVAWTCAVFAGACTSHDGAASAPSTGAPVLKPPEGLGLRLVSLPDFSLIEEPMREQLRERYSSSKLKIENRGTTPGERAGSGALIGAGSGALIGAAAGSPATGALVGAGAGAAVGAFTSPRDINLGPPPWRHAAYYRHRHYAAHRVWCEHHPAACHRVATR